MRVRLVLVLAVALGPMSAFSAELPAACKPLMAAMEKSVRADHSTTTQTGKEIVTGITAGGANYIQMGGKWRKSPMTAAQNIQRSQENLRNAKVYTCQPAGELMVDGTPGTKYLAHTESDFGTVDSVIVVGKGNSLVLQVENITKFDGRANHYVTKYTYGSIKAPM